MMEGLGKHNRMMIKEIKRKTKYAKLIVQSKTPGISNKIVPNIIGVLCTIFKS